MKPTQTRLRHRGSGDHTVVYTSDRTLVHHYASYQTAVQAASQIAWANRVGATVDGSLVVTYNPETNKLRFTASAVKAVRS